MPRTRTRFLLATFLSAFAVLPASAAAAPELTLSDTVLAGSSLNDGILAPGESVNVTPVWTVGEVPFNGGNATIAATSGSNVATPTYLQPLPAGSPHEGTYPLNPFVVQLGSQFVCGTNAPVTASVDGIDGHGSYKLSIPTGVAGPHTNYVSTDVGDVISDAETIDSKIDVTATGKVKSVRVKFDSITHEYSVRWYDITLVSPSGTRVKIWSRSGDDTQKSFTNVTFSDSATLLSNSPSVTQFNDVTLKPDEPLSAFNGEDAKGANPWTLEVRDVHDINTARSGHRSARSGSGRAGGGGELVGQVNGWSMDLATAVCSREPVPQIAPTPLVLNPTPSAQAPATVIDASESVDPGKNNAGNADGAIVKYEWDLDGNATNGFEVDRGTLKTVDFPGGSQGPRKIRLRVTDNDGLTAIKEVDALITRAPSISGTTVTPAAPEAGQLVTLEATANDPDGAIAAYGWDFDGDGVFEVTKTDGPTVQYSWATSGPHVVRVKVTDNIGATSYKAFIVTVANKPPVAKIKANVSPAVLGQPVTFDASESSDPDGTIVSYDWDLDGNVGFEVSGGGVSTFSKTFDESGTRTVSVKVTDNSGQSAVATMSIYVAAPPKGVIKASTNTPKPGDTVTFDARSSTDSEIGGAIAKYEWDLDGNTTYETTGAVVSRAYPNVSNVQVKLRVTGSTGAKADTFTNIAVANPVVVTPAPTGGVSPTPTPKPTPGPGIGNVPETPGPGVNVDVLPPGPITNDGKKNVAEIFNGNGSGGGGMGTDGDTGEAYPELGTLPSGFTAKITVAAKQKGKKVVKGGIAVKITANGPATVTVKGMLDAKTAKKLKLKTKKPIAVASGKLVIKKAGTYKFIVKVPKKYQRYVKKANKSKLVLVTAAVETATKDALPLSKTIVLVK